MATTDQFFALKLFTALGCGLVAGVFFAFSTFVMNALARLQPREGIAAIGKMLRTPEDVTCSGAESHICAFSRGMKAICLIYQAFWF
jgi:uncharacterized membrane protein